jgi:chromatin modification-related protein VID21
MFQDLSTQGPASGKVDLDRLQAAAEIFPLEHVVSKMAHKSVRTTDWTSAIDEKKTIAVCARIAELKEQGLWSFRQPLKQKPPPRVISHWDYMLKEMEWMSTDFYEERKFKMVGAYKLSKAVKQYFDSSDRASLLHKVRLRGFFTDVSGRKDYV